MTPFYFMYKETACVTYAYPVILKRKIEANSPQNIIVIYLSSVIKYPAVI